MADGDKTAALVVALSAQLTKFEKDMNRAGDVADKTVSGIEDRFAKANPTFAGSFLGNFLGNITTKGLEQAVKFATDLVDRFIDLDKVSKLVGVSMNDIFGVQQAASKFGAPIDDVTTSVKNLGTLLNQMQRGEQNSLTALFDANPKALQGINRDALTLQKTFEVVADIVRNGFNPLDKIDLAKAAGQTETMVRFLEQGGRAVTDLSSAASKTAPDLQKLADGAKSFDDAWRSAVTNVKAYLSEHFLDFIKQDLTDIVALLGAAQKFLSLFKGGPIEAQASQAADTLKQLQATIDSIGKTRDKDLATPTRVTVTGGVTDRSGFSHVPNKAATGGETKDSFDRTEEQITKHTASINADTIAVSQNTSVQAQLRAEFQLLNTIRKDEGEVTQAQIDQYTKLRATMSAELALEQAKISLKAEHKASFIAASEGAAIATAANTKAVDSVQKLNSASSTLGSALSSAFADAVVEGKNLNDVFTSLIKTLEKAAINSVFSSIFNQQAGGGLSPFLSFLGIGKNAEGTDNWRGGPTWVGEKGPEIVNLPRGAQVVPNAVASRMGGGPTSIGGPTINIARADDAGMARVNRALQEHAQAIKSIVGAQYAQATGVSR